MFRKLLPLLILMVIVACTKIEPEPTPQPTQGATQSIAVEMATATASLTATTTPSATPQSTPSPTVIPSATVFLTVTPRPTITPPSAQISLNSEIETTDSRRLEIVNQIGGAVTSVAVQEHLAYVGIGPRLAVANIADPANPYIVSWSNILPGIVRQITLHNDLAYVGMGEAGLWIFDISDSATLRLLGQVQTTNPAQHFVLQENVIYMVNNQRGKPIDNQVMSVVDVSDPSQPREINTLPLPIQATRMVVVESYLYVSFYPAYYGYEDAFWIFDLTNPAEPVMVADIPELAGRDMVLTSQGLVIAQRRSLALADVSDPAHPQIIVKSPDLLDSYTSISAIIQNGDSLFALSFHGDIGYCGGGLSAFDLSQMDNVQGLDGIGVGCNVYDMVVADDLLYLATDHALRIIDIHDPTALSYIGELTTLPPMEEIAAGDYLFGLVRVENSYQIFTFDVENPERPLLLSQFGFDYLVSDFAANGIHTYLGTYWLAAVDMTDPYAPYIMAEYGLDKLVESSFNLILSDERLYASLGGNLGIFDPLTLEWLGGDGDELYGSYRSFVVSENTLWTWEPTTNRLQAVDVTDPEHILPIASLEQVTQTNRTQLFVDQGFLYIINGSDCQSSYRTVCEEESLTIVDVADPSKMMMVGTISIPGQVHGMEKIGDTLVLIGDDLWLVDVANPNQPQLISHFYTPGYAKEIAVVNDTIYLTDDIGGLLILRLVDSES